MSVDVFELPMFARDARATRARELEAELGKLRAELSEEFLQRIASEAGEPVAQPQ